MKVLRLKFIVYSMKAFYVPAVMNPSRKTKVLGEN